MATAYRSIGADERAGERRVAARLDARSGSGSAAAELTEVSIYGCRLRLPADGVWAGSIDLSLDGGAPVAAQVVWNQGGMIGCRFDTPISRAQLRALTIRAV